ncbi:hypothetical protein [Clostridium sp.]|uniref:hypothetical protein n=1 Tax=Clostridium sp. TaxID=1506 RepID=UPI003217AD54
MTIKAINQFTITDLYDGERGLDGLQGEQGLQGIPGNSAKMLTLISTKNVVAFNKDNSPKDSSDITLSAFKQNFNSNITWTSNPAVSLSGTGNIRTLLVSNFVSNNQITITISADGLSDSITIVKVQDGATGTPGVAGSNGAAGQDAYTIVLSNESHTFAGNTTSALASNTKSEVMAYKGSERIAATIGTITGFPTGMSAPITNNNTINACFSPTVTSSMTTKNGVLTIPITVDGKIFTKYFTYSLSLQGLQGDNGKTSYFHIKYSPVVSPTSAQMTEAPDVYIGTYVDYIETDSADPNKYTWSRFEGIQGTQGIPGTNGTNGKTSYLHIAYADNSTGTAGFDIANSINKLYIGQYTDFNPNDSTDPNVYSWTKIKGDTGANGANGVGITSVDIFYYLSTSPTTTTGGTWQTTSPGWVNGKYLWSKTITTLTNGASTTSTPICITGTKGDTGATGSAGTGIESVTELYYLANGKTTADIPNPPTNWVTSPPTWSSGKYIWTCSKIVYKTPTSTSYTTPICDSSWEAVNEVQVGGRNLLLNSGEKITSSVYNIKAYTLSESVENGTQVTLSIKGLLGDGKTYWGIYNSGGSVSMAGITPTDRNAQGIYVKTFNWIVGASTNTTLYVYQMPSSTVVESTIDWIKLEKGNKATDWTPAPEDVYDYISNETQEITKKYDAAIETKADSIILSVSETYSTKDDNNSLETTLKSLIEQTAENITFKFDGANGYTSEIDGKLQEFIDKFETYIQFSSEGISLGKINNPFIASLGNTELSFLQDGVKVAYISNNKLYITDADIRNKLTIGNPTNGYFDYVPRQNGNLSMKWRAN